MQLLLQALERLEEYGQITGALARGRSVGVSGAAQINRSHLIAALYQSTGRPMAVICQDDMAAKRTAAELAAFLGQEPPVLPGRELTFYDAAVVSRQWEQKRLRQLYHLTMGKTPLQIFTWESLSLRTMPRQTLLNAALTLRQGESYDL